MAFFDFMTQEIAIDLGTANTLIIHNDKVVVDEPSIVAKDIILNKVVAIGKKAQQMHGKTHKTIETIRPLKDGVIADFSAAEQMIRGMIKMIPRRKSIFSPALKMVVCIPSGITEVEKRAVKDSAEHAGAKEVFLIHERMAEKIKISVGAAMQELEEPPANFAVHGRDLMSGIPKEIIVNYKEIARAFDQTISQIEQAVLAALGQTPPELSADIYNTGIYLTGGGSMLRGLDKRISLKTKLPVYVAEDPLRAVARGTGIALKNTENFPFLIR